VVPKILSADSAVTWQPSCMHPVPNELSRNQGVFHYKRIRDENPGRCHVSHVVLDSPGHAPPSPPGCARHPLPCHGARTRAPCHLPGLSADRSDFVARLAHLAEQGAWIVYAWALLPNHAHLLVRTGQRPLPQSMRSLLTGYAGAFNRHHHRVGHLFQNRYKSIVVEDDPYLLELVRYLHLNPLRAKLVADLHTLDRFPWTGHSAVLGAVPRSWQDTATILMQFGATRRRAVPAYRAFVAEGIAAGRRPEFQGGGLRRSQGGWAAVTALRRGREAYQGDERILGSSDFVEGYRRAVAATSPAPSGFAPAPLMARVCRHVGVAPTALAGGGRTRPMTRAREGIAYLWTTVLGHPGRPLAAVLGIRPQNVYRAAAQGRTAAAEWERLL
jgi:putative transposase